VIVRTALLLFLVAASTAAGAVELLLDRRGIEQAIFIGQSRVDQDHARFHAPYRLAVGRAPVDYVDVVTPFRRVVLAAERRMRLGDRSFGQRQALELMAAAPEQLDLLIELTFHPMNAYVGVPDYEVTLTPPGGQPVRPRALDRVPRFGPRVDGTPVPTPAQPGAPIPRGSEPMLGGTVIASFDGRPLAATAYDVMVWEKGKEIARARLPLSAIR
jgi:hypothetical protein